MEKMIESIVSDLKEIYREAYIQYKPVVERVCAEKPVKLKLKKF